jgi:hypothetical protein
MTGNIDKLPRWARMEIERLRANVKSLEEALSHATGSTPSRVEVNPFSLDLNYSRRFLQEHETVRYSFGERQHIDVRLDGNSLRIMGSDLISVLPAASNVIEVKPV